MIKTLIFGLVGLIVGGGVGFGGGTFFFASTEGISGESSSVSAGDVETIAEDVELEYANFSNQFIVPLIEGSDVGANMILSLALEVEAAGLAEIYEKEPKLRALFLQSLFNHANNGGFDGTFTDFSTTASLKRELFDIAKSHGGDMVKNVLILDMVRQE